MKELSIEEKARRYDGAIKRLEDIETGKCQKTFMFTEGLFDYIFPELAESEDERIRKELLQIAKESEDSFYMVMTPNKREKLIAWLEKQGEQKSVTDLRTWKYIADYVVTKWFGIGQYLDTPRLATIAEELQKKYSLKQKQGEQKVIIPKFRVGDVVRYDEDGEINRVIEIVEEGYKLEHGTHILCFQSQDNWELVEHSAWSEEDEGFFNLLLAIFTNEYPNGVFSTDNITVFKGNCVTSNRIITWLKSLKYRIQPQPQWKPSDEQMKALNAINCNGAITYAGQGNHLISLYKQLKAQKGEEL